LNSAKIGRADAQTSLLDDNAPAGLYAGGAVAGSRAPTPAYERGRRTARQEPRHRPFARLAEDKGANRAAEGHRAATRSLTSRRLRTGNPLWRLAAQAILAHARATDLFAVVAGRPPRPAPNLRRTGRRPTTAPKPREGRNAPPCHWAGNHHRHRRLSGEQCFREYVHPQDVLPPAPWERNYHGWVLLLITPPRGGGW